MSDIIRWFAGVDWASEIHQVVLVDAQGIVIGERTFPHGGEGLGAMCDWLLTSTGAPAETIAAAIEVPHGPVVETLTERGFPVHAINPKQLDRFRDRFTVAGAKDDRLDGRVLADSHPGRARHHRSGHRPHPHPRGPVESGEPADQGRAPATRCVVREARRSGGTRTGAAS